MLMGGMKRPGGIFGAPMQTPSTPPIASTTGGYQKPDTLHMIAGVLGDTLATIGGGQGTFLPMMARQQEMAQREQQAQAQRAAEFADFTKRYDYELAHPKPSQAQPYRFESNNGDVYQLDAQGQPVKIFADPTPKMNFIPDGLGGGRWVAVPNAAQSAPPSAPVGKLTPMGGAAPGGPRTFPVR